MREAYTYLIKNFRRRFVLIYLVDNFGRFKILELKTKKSARAARFANKFERAWGARFDRRGSRSVLFGPRA